MIKTLNWITEMINRKVKTSAAGFTLIEMMISMALLGTIMIGVYNLYLSQQSQNLIQEDVVELQQNLRVAMDTITRDMRMAGFLIGDSDPVQNAGNNDPDSITLSTASASGVYARIVEADYTGPAGNSVAFTVDSVSSFAANDVVRIIRPPDNGVPLGTGETATVTSITDTGTCAPGSKPAPCLSLNSTAVVGGIVFKRGDVNARTQNDGTELYPNTINYAVVTGGNCPVDQNCIAKDINGNGTWNQIVASNITDLQFKYYLIDNSNNEFDSPTDLSQVRAIRVTIDGATSMTVADLGGNPRTRQLTTIVKIRNR